MGGTGLYFWLAGGDHVTIGIVTFVAGVLMSVYAVAAHYYPTWPKARMWVFALILTWAVLGYDIYDRHYESYNWSDVDKLERVSSRSFRDETVVLDGKFFLSPTFENVTFAYNGRGGFAMDNAHFIPPKQGEAGWQVASRNNAVKETIKLENALFNASGCQSWVQNRGLEQMEGVSPPK